MATVVIHFTNIQSLLWWYCLHENRSQWKGRNSTHNERRMKDFVRKHSFSKLWNNYFQLHVFVNRLNTEKKNL